MKPFITILLATSALAQTSLVNSAPTQKDSACYDAHMDAIRNTNNVRIGQTTCSALAKKIEDACSKNISDRISREADFLNYCHNDEHIGQFDEGLKRINLLAAQKVTSNHKCGMGPEPQIECKKYLEQKQADQTALIKSSHKIVVKRPDGKNVGKLRIQHDSVTVSLKPEDKELTWYVKAPNKDSPYCVRAWMESTDSTTPSSSAMVETCVPLRKCTPKACGTLEISPVFPNKEEKINSKPIEEFVEKTKRTRERNFWMVLGGSVLAGGGVFTILLGRAHQDKTTKKFYSQYNADYVTYDCGIISPGGTSHFCSVSGGAPIVNNEYSKYLDANLLDKVLLGIGSSLVGVGVGALIFAYVTSQVDSSPLQSSQASRITFSPFISAQRQGLFIQGSF